jgi:group I intron endonuclease
VDLSIRFYQYYNLKHISKGNMTIYKALLKYGYSNFQLEILEYCEVKDTLEREQHYMDICNPEYNILKIAGSCLGRKHTEATIAKLKGRVHSRDTLEKLSAIAAGRLFSEETRAKISASLKGIGGIKV